MPIEPVTPAVAADFRKNLRTPSSAGVSILTSSQALNDTHCGRVLLCNTAATNFIVAVPSASTLGNGYVVRIRKADTGTGTVTIATPSPAVTLGTLRVQSDTIELFSDGTAWYVMEFPRSETRPTITMTANGITIIDAKEFGQCGDIFIPVASFVGAATEANTFRIVNADIGQLITLFIARDATAGTKTINFVDSGITYRKTWGTGAFTHPVSQQHTFTVRRTGPTTFFAQQQRTY
jgi:hypothetical protein